MKLQETLKRIKRIRRDITDERDISYDDTAFLQANQDIIKDYFDGDPILYEWAGIPESLYGRKTRFTKGDCYAICEFITAILRDNPDMITDIANGLGYPPKAMGNLLGDLESVFDAMICVENDKNYADTRQDAIICEIVPVDNDDEQ